MKTKEVQHILQRYFNGKASLEEEQKLEAYFQSEDVAGELKQYTEFFGAYSELREVPGEATIEDDVMDFILENEHIEKSKYRHMWRMVTGIAASIIIILGGVLIYEQQQKSIEDTFEDPEIAYAHAAQTIKYVSAKYNKGIAELAQFNRLEKAAKPLEKSVEPINEVFDEVLGGSGQSQSQSQSQSQLQ